MSEILTCVLCGRRGVKDYVVHRREFGGSEPEVTQWRCRNQEACQRRRTDDTQAAGGAASTADEHGGPAGAFASAAAVAGLAREVEAVRRATDRLRGLPAQLEEFGRVLTHLAEELAAKAPRAQPVVAPSYLDIPPGSPSAVREILEDLIAWMTDVYVRYPDAAAGLPECWLWHPDVVEELLVLRYAWLAAYQHPKSTVALATDWHDRSRPGTVRRIKTVAGSCSLEAHLPRNGHRPGARPVVPLADALRPISDWWAEHRGDPAPVPDEAQLAQASVFAEQRRRGGGRR